MDLRWLGWCANRHFTREVLFGPFKGTYEDLWWRLHDIALSDLLGYVTGPGMTRRVEDRAALAQIRSNLNLE